MLCSTSASLVFWSQQSQRNSRWFQIGTCYRRAMDWKLITAVEMLRKASLSETLIKFQESIDLSRSQRCQITAVTRTTWFSRWKRGSVLVSLPLWGGGMCMFYLTLESRCPIKEFTATDPVMQTESRNKSSIKNNRPPDSSCVCYLIFTVCKCLQNCVWNKQIL